MRRTLTYFTAALVAAGGVLTAGLHRNAAASAPTVKAIKFMATSPSYALGSCWVLNRCNGFQDFDIYASQFGCTDIAPDSGLKVLCTVDINGTFTSVTCGTGWTNPATTGGAIEEQDGDVLTLTNVRIFFVAGVGTVQATATDAQGISGPLTGTMTLVPVQPDIPALSGSCAQDYLIPGVLTTTVP